MTQESRESRFKRIAPKRVRRVLHELELLMNLSNKNHYLYTETEVDKIFDAIEKQFKETRNSFSIKRSKDFTL